MRGMVELGLKDLQTVVQDGLDTFRSEMHPVCDDLARIQTSQRRDQKALAASLRLIADSLGYIVNGTFETRLRLDDDIGGEGLSSSSGTGEQQRPMSLTERLDTVTASALDVLNAGTTTEATNAPTAGTNQSSTNPLTSSSNNTNNPTSGATETDGVFLMETQHMTVQQLWKEWTVGVFGRIPVREMVGGGFRKSEGQTKLLARRKVVIDEIKRQARERTELESTIVSRMDEYKAKEKLSMTKLRYLIKLRAQNGETLPFWLE